jgi:glutamate-ammonia-ligase adenylyltransferase
MRLRPSGEAGPIATSLEAFARYQRESAWTWEHMALTRARIIYGPDFIAAPLGDAIRDILTAPRDADALLGDVADMRMRMERELGSGDIWNIKQLRGGLVDIEFIAQYLQLRHGHEAPHVLAPNTTDALARLRDAGLLDRATADELIAAMGLWRNLQGIIRLGFGEGFTEDDAREDSRDLVARACGALGFDALRGEITETAGRVHAIFETLIPAPAGAGAD